MKNPWLSCACAVLLAAGVLGGWLVWRSGQAMEPEQAGRTESEDHRPDSDSDLVRNLVSSEELILELTPHLKHLNRSVKNLQLPDGRARSLFADQVQLVDLRDEPATTPAMVGLVQRTWPVDAESRQNGAELEIWTSVLDDVEFVEHAKFYFVRGEFRPGGNDEFEADMGFEGLLHWSGGGIASAKSKIKAVWKRNSGTTSKFPWQISSWRVVEFQTLDTRQLLFTEVLDQVLSNPNELDAARASLHEQMAEDLIQGVPVKRIEGDLYEGFYHYTTLEHPGLAVVDFDIDGDDDLYVTFPIGRNMLLRNNGNGTFSDFAAQAGLDVAGFSTSPIFADFDNDGDADLFLGRSRQRCQYFINENGRFVDKSDSHVGVQLPYLVSAVSAADYNGDGLLDVYLGTYGSGQLAGANSDAPANWPGIFLSPEVADRFLTFDGDRTSF